MPYPIAHPAAVLPLIAPLGRRAVPSALVIGSLVPDLWYFVPLASREASHSLAGLFFFCLPVGLAAYLLFHLLLKRPLLALLPARLAPFGGRRLPDRSWLAVLVCLLLGAATHLAWDSFTHENAPIVQAFAALQMQLFAIDDYTVRVFQLLQHASTLLGTAYVAWWTWRAFDRLPRVPSPADVFSPRTRLLVIATLLAAAAGWAAAQAAPPVSLDPLSLRSTVRSAGLAAAEALGVAVLAYCALMTWLLGRSRAPRSPDGR